MHKHRTDILLELFKINPNGLNMDQLIEMLKVKNKKDVGNTIQLLKRNGKNICREGDIYKLIDNAPVQKNSLSPIYNAIIKALSENPNGLTNLELTKICGTDKKTIINRIWYLRNKFKYNIPIKDGKYYYQKGSLNSPQNPVNNTKDTNHSNSLIPKQYHDIFIKLSDNDKRDCIDMLRKSLYYQKSALSLLESNKEVLSFVTSIEGGL